jgi:DNA-binding cell septation regulator SpoVG
MTKKIVTKVVLFPVENSTTKAIGHLIIGEEWMRVNCSVVQGKDGLFMSLPRYKGKDREGKDKWYHSVFFINKTLQNEAQTAVLAEYDVMTKELDAKKVAATQPVIVPALVVSPSPSPVDEIEDGCPF